MKKHRYKLLTLTLLLSLATAVIHMINKMIAATAVLKDMLHVSDKNFYKWRFGRVYYTKQGSGIRMVMPCPPESSLNTIKIPQTIKYFIVCLPKP